MVKKIILNDTDIHLKKSDLPLLIHGDDGYGASLFSVSVVADLYTQNSNIVFLCGYHMARDEFFLQTNSENDSAIFNEATEVADLKTKRSIFIPSDKPELLQQLLKVFDDKEDRIIFFKNFDLFDESVFAAIENYSNVVLMGNIDKCSYSKLLLKNVWKTQIYFSIPEKDVRINIPKLERYKGYITSNSKEGFVSLVQ